MSTSATKRAIADGGKAAGLSLLLGLLLAFAPLFSLLALPLLPVPAACMAARHGAYAGALTGLVAALSCVPLAGLEFALLVLLLTALVGVGMGMAARTGMSLLKLFCLVAALFLVSMAVWFGVILAMANAGPVAAMHQATDEMLGSTRGIYIDMGMDEQAADELLGRVREFTELLPYLMPGIMLIASILLSGSALAVAGRAFKRLGQPFPGDFRFADFRLHFIFAYGMIAGLLCELIASQLGEDYGFTVSLVGKNLLMVAQMLFFIQGLAIAHFLLSYRRVGRGKRVLVFGLLALMEVLLSLVSWLGLFDTWFDYRKRFSARSTERQA